MNLARPRLAPLTASPAAFGQTRKLALRVAVCGVLALTAASAAHSQAWPAKPVRLVVAYPPGGPVDQIARFVSEPLGRALGQSVVIDNRAGAGGVIGTDHVAKSAPDGYTLLMTSTPMAIQETLNAKMPYSALRDFTHVIKVAEGPQLLLVGGNSSVRSVREFIDYAKAQDGKLSYSSPSTGGANHLATEMLKARAGFKALGVPFNGGSPAEIALMGGQVDFMFSALTTALPHVETGRMRALGVTTLKRLATLPNMPTIAETVPGFEAVQWHGIVGPANLPRAITDRVNAEVTRVMEHPDMKKRLVTQFLEFTPESPAQFTEFIRQNTAMWAKVIKDANITAQ